jgi:hypothetical protein
MFTVSVDDSFRLGQRTNAAAFGAVLDGAETPPSGEPIERR